MDFNDFPINLFFVLNVKFVLLHFASTWDEHLAKTTPNPCHLTVMLYLTFPFCFCCKICMCSVTMLI